MRIVLNTSFELEQVLLDIAKKSCKSINQLLIEDAERNI